MAPGVLRSRKLLVQLLDDLHARGFPPEQITLGGFSQGSLMTVDAGLRYPHKLAGLVGISGWIFELEATLKELSPVAREQRLLVTHGQFDPIIPFAPACEQVMQLKAAGLRVEWREFAKDHTIAGEQELSVIREFVRAGYSEK
jgi:phospholipase/carboxylesterase